MKIRQLPYLSLKQFQPTSFRHILFKRLWDHSKFRLENVKRALSPMLDVLASLFVASVLFGNRFTKSGNGHSCPMIRSVARCWRLERHHRLIEDVVILPQKNQENWRNVHMRTKYSCKGVVEGRCASSIGFVWSFKVAYMQNCAIFVKVLNWCYS